MGSLLSRFKTEVENDPEVFYDAESDLSMEVEVFYNAKSDLLLEAEGNHPLELLTEYGWIHVLACVDMPMDRYNVANSHPFFWRIFHSDLRDLWLSGMFLASVPFLLNHLPFKDVLGLRLVNRLSKSTVDHCLQQGQVISLQNRINSVLLHPPNLISREGVHSNTSLPVAPWMNLSLHCFGCQYGFVDADFLSFFRRNGHQVKELWVYPLNNRRSHPVEFMMFLRNMLRYLPNVKKIFLQLSGTLDGDRESDHQRLAGLVTQFVEQNPFPALPSLEKLTIYGLHSPRRETQALVSHAILQAYGRRLQELALRLSVNLPRNMTCLHTLTLELHSPEILASIQASGAPLCNLTVEIQHNSGIKPIQLFRALQSFKNTLAALSVFVESWIWAFSRIGHLPMEFPLVKTLILGLVRNDCMPNNLLIALSFPNLEELELVVNMPATDDDSVETEARREMLREWFGVDQFQKSNILWTHLVSLQLITIVDYNNESENRSIFVKRPIEL